MGPNNTKTPTPTAGSAPTPTPTPAPVSPVPFSGQAPMAPPLASQNSIPSSATGDIILHSDHTPASSAPNKKLLIAIIAGVIIIIGILIFIIINANKKTSQSTTVNNTLPVKNISAQELNASYDNLKKLLTTKVTDASKSKYERYEDIVSAHGIFIENFQQYVNSHLNALSIDSVDLILSAFGDGALVVADYLRSDSYAENLINEYIKNPDNIKEYINNGINSNTMSNIAALDTLSYIQAYYYGLIKRMPVIMETECIKNKRLDIACLDEIRQEGYINHEDLLYEDINVNELHLSLNERYEQFGKDFLDTISQVDSIMKELQ